ncbi:uncharacterized protein TNCV_524241 [Trichonephila clavipes]|nr:uncharacterized protein TNCV_524241 [Trichonephila clavipes]
MRSKSQCQIKLAVTFHRISPSENGYFYVSGLLKTGSSISHDTHQLTDFTALAALLPPITEPSVALHTHYGCRTSTRRIYVCDPFTHIQEAAVAEWYRYRTVACFVTGSSPVPLKTRLVGQRCTLSLSRAETSSRWCGVVVRRGGCQLRCRPRHLTMVQNYVVRRQKPSCS